MDIKLNQYVDFNKLFFDLYNKHEDDILENPDNTIYYNITKFIIDNNKHKYQIDFDSSEIVYDKVTFVFNYEYNDANESNTESSWNSFLFTYCFTLEDFIESDFDKG